MPQGMKGILCIKFDLFKLNIDFWAAYARTLGFSQNLGWEMGIGPPPRSGPSYYGARAINSNTFESSHLCHTNIHAMHNASTGAGNESPKTSPVA